MTSREAYSREATRNLVDDYQESASRYCKVSVHLVLAPVLGIFPHSRWQGPSLVIAYFPLRGET
jgi:hypothetical protein